MSTAKKTLYAAIGAGGIALEKARTLPQRVTTLPKTLASRTSDLTISIDLGDIPKRVVSLGQSVPETATRLVDEAKGLSDRATQRVTKTYRDLSKRGEVVVRKVRGSASTKRAVGQTKTARAKVKSATTSVAKAVEATTEAAGDAVEKAAEQAS